MKLLVPATTTNFGAGFDTFGLALNLYNTFELLESDSFAVNVEGEGKDLPIGEDNLVIRVYKRCCEVFSETPRPFLLYQVNRVPVARGLGSSATAIVGGILIFEKLHARNLPLEKKLNVALEFENHPDNILPAFVGGFVVCAGKRELSYVKLPFPQDIALTFVVPDFELPTQKAREVLKENISLADAVYNVQRASLFVASLMQKEYELLKVAVEDRLHQPYRADLIRGFEEVLRAGYSKGAYGVFLSGAGPTLCALCTPDTEREVGKEMQKAFEKEGIKARILHLRASDRGAFWL